MVNFAFKILLSNLPFKHTDKGEFRLSFENSQKSKYIFKMNWNFVKIRIGSLENSGLKKKKENN